MDVLGARLEDFRIGDHQIAAIIADGSQRQMAHARSMGWQQEADGIACETKIDA